MRKMISFWQEANETYRRHANSFDQAYDLVSHATQFSELHIKEIAAQVCGWEDIGHIPKSSLWALHRVLINRDMGFVPANHFQWKAQRWVVVPQSKVKTIQQVKDWVREYQDSFIKEGGEGLPSKTLQSSTESLDEGGTLCFQEFINKARALVHESRKRRQPIRNYGIGPYREPPGCDEQHSGDPSSFTTNEFTVDGPLRLVLEFLKLWAIDGLVPPKSHLDAVGSTILRATGLYKDLPFDKTTAFLFLKETGYISPWAPFVSGLRLLNLPTDNPESVTNQLHDAAKLSAEKARFSDKMKDLRKDWGKLEVFCIDSEDTEDIDDGFSLEEIPGEPRNHWVHVHVANPTAFMSPSSPIARYADRVGKSRYGFERRDTMLPLPVSGRFSLGAGRPTLTFSSKISDDGQIIDSQITPGRIHNVVFASYDTLKASLAPGASSLPDAFTYSVGPATAKTSSSRAATMVEGFTEAQIQTLQKIKSLCRAARHQRFSQGAVPIGLRSQNSEASVQGLQPFESDSISHLKIRGDPSIRIQGTVFQPMDEGVPEHLQPLYDANQMIPEIMGMACESAARWCRQREIAVLFLSTKTDPALPPISEYRKRVLEPITRNKTASAIPHFVGVEFMSLYGSRNLSPFPQKHHTLGIDAYVQCTSPLRRFSDMVCHWQIEATLLHEGAVRTGAQPHGSTPALPFRFAQVEELCTRTLAHDAELSRMAARDLQHWNVQLLFRNFYFGEGDPLPETFTICVRRPGFWVQREAQGIVCELNLNAMVTKNEVSEQEGGLQRDTWWEARITSVDTCSRYVRVEPLRKIR